MIENLAVLIENLAVLIKNLAVLIKNLAVLIENLAVSIKKVAVMIWSWAWRFLTRCFECFRRQVLFRLELLCKCRRLTL